MLGYQPGCTLRTVTEWLAGNFAVDLTSGSNSPRSFHKQMSEPISTIRNLGPASEVAFGRAGIQTAQELHELGPDEAYRRLLKSGGKPHFIGYMALVMGLQGRPWNDARGKERTALRDRFDALKSSVSIDIDSRLEAAMDEIGVVDRSS